MENEQLSYNLDIHYVLVSKHLQNFDNEFLSIIKNYKTSSDKDGVGLIGEYLNKLYCTLFTLRYGLDAKDSIAVNLVAKYVYEIFIDFFYIFKDGSTESARIKDFFDYEKNPEKGDWTKVNRADRIAEIDENFLVTHKGYYSRLNKHAHPSIFSLFVNRRGLDFEKWMIFSSVLMIISTIIMILNHSKTLTHFDFSHEKLSALSSENIRLSNLISPKSE